MKVLIWLCCLTPVAILFVVIEKSSGVRLGPLPKVLIASTAAAIAVKLCKQKDKRKKQQKDNNENANKTE